jgi:hypothetical protein
VTFATGGLQVLMKSHAPLCLFTLTCFRLTSVASSSQQLIALRRLQASNGRQGPRPPSRSLPPVLLPAITSL